jgi:methyl-accepting chemotaxis protein
LNHQGSYNELTESINSTEDVIEEIFVNTQTQAATIEELAASMEQISANTANVDKAATDQYSSVEELGSFIRSLSGLIESLQENGTELQKEFAAITEKSLKGKESSESVSATNSKILQNSIDIQGITEIIDELFDRINLLALNATIEAARAGESGRGFAVVAGEVGKLADNSSNELGKIRDLVSNNRSDTESATRVISDVVEFIEEIVVSISDAGRKVEETQVAIAQQKQIRHEMIDKTDNVRDKSGIISTATREQNAAINEVVMSIESTNTIVQGIAGHAQVLKDDYERLKQIADRLNVIISGTSSEVETTA